MKNTIGPSHPVSQAIHKLKYRLEGETFEDAMARIAGALRDDDEHFRSLYNILLEMRFLPGGRVQAAIGAPRKVTAFNCFVSGPIPDSMDGIMGRAGEAAQTMRLGGGIGYDFSTIRPDGSLIESLDTRASGPVSFMGIFDAVCKTIASAGHRRGAQMAVLRVDHPDIIKFITAKHNNHNLTQFNVSIGATDAFMRAVQRKEPFTLSWNGRAYQTVDANYLWELALRSTWDWAEPGVLFLDTINKKNNLWYCETITATNPCLHPDTLIETVEGRVRIADIKEPTLVYTSMPDGSLGVAKATSSWVSKRNAAVWKIVTRNGKVLKATSDHKVLTHEKGWVEIKDLELGDRIVQLCRARRGAAYSGVKLTTEDNRAYRMEHRMIAEAVYGDLGDNVVHHINGDTYDNHIDNFEVMSASEHNRLTATTTHPQNHQVHCPYSGDFVATGRSPKRITPMPSYLKSDMKNQLSNCVVEIIKDFEVTDVYDLTVEGTHNMIGDFMVVHNCAEQPLPPYGSCLLGSFNMVKYIDPENKVFLYEKFKRDIYPVVRAMDNIIDRTIYPLFEQECEAKNKRRMGLGVTGLANALEILGYPYGSPEFLSEMKKILETLRDTAYLSSVSLAVEKGSFPMFDPHLYTTSGFMQTMPEDIIKAIKQFGIRNSHLLSIAPTGTISLTADNISSGIEPVFSYGYERLVQLPEGPKVMDVSDYAFANFGVKGRKADDISVEEHVDVLNLASRYVDSSVSKTCNVGPSVSWDRFKDVYMRAYNGGASGCTTFRLDGKRFGILIDKKADDDPQKAGEACYFDPETGRKTCE